MQFRDWHEALPMVPPKFAAEQGINPERLVIGHSLSKRSNLPGLRFGLFGRWPGKGSRHIRGLRPYAGASLLQPLRRVAERAWADEAHVIETRRLYGEKYDIAGDVFSGCRRVQPTAGWVLFVAARQGWRGCGAETVARDRHSGLAGRLSGA